MTFLVAAVATACGDFSPNVGAVEHTTQACTAGANPSGAYAGAPDAACPPDAGRDAAPPY